MLEEVFEKLNPTAHFCTAHKPFKVLLGLTQLHIDREIISL